MKKKKFNPNTVLKNARLDMGMAMKELAEITGIDESALSRFETGERELAVRHAKLLSRALGVSAISLLGIEDDDIDPSRRQSSKNRPVRGTPMLKQRWQP